MSLLKKFRRTVASFYWLVGAHEEDDYPSNLAVTHHDGNRNHDVVVSELEGALSQQGYRTTLIRRFRMGGTRDKENK